MNNLKIVFTLASVILFVACSKADNEATLAGAVSNQVAIENLQAKQSKNVEKGDKNFPLESYQRLSDGKQVVFAYYAVSQDPVDYEKIAATISQPYRYEYDEFKKRDFLNALKPQIDAEISRAKQNKYYKIDINNTLDKYDFESKSFRLIGLPQGDSYQYFVGQAGNYTFTYVNVEKFQKFIVPDEARARQIESMRSKYNTLKIIAYIFANDTEIGRTNLKSEIMKIHLLDGRGNLLAEMDGN
jgi:hypothetical protein